jgi:short-subunit dehydrogenase
VRTPRSLAAVLRRPGRVRDGDLRPLAEQVVVVTGATSGIGLATVRALAARGAAVVTAARDREALVAEEQRLRAQGARVVHVVADVGDPDDVDRIAETAVEQFGGVDTWVNVAGISVFGGVEEVTLDDMHRLFDTDFWGVVHGTRRVLAHFRARAAEEGGGAFALVTVGSVFGDRAAPVESTYSAAKHAVHGFVEATRTELEAQHVPVSVTLVHPGRVDTPFDRNAQSYLDQHPAHRDVTYPPEAVAEAVLHAAEHPVRDLFVGGQAKLAVVAQAISPRLVDDVTERYFFWGQRRDAPSPPRETSGLHHPGGGHEVHGDHPAWARSHSWWLRAEEHAPALRRAAAVAGAVGVGVLVARRRRRSGR